jgi:beta-aspartyl-peptidase (threonine type)
LRSPRVPARRTRSHVAPVSFEAYDLSVAQPAVIVHGGAGRGDSEIAALQDAGCDEAADRAWEILVAGGSALDAVTAAVVFLEDHPFFNAGVGSVLTSEGTVEMDASVMDGRTLAAGAVGVVTGVRNPIRAARAVMEDGRQVLIAGSAVEAWARMRGLPTERPEVFVTDRQLRSWRSATAPEGGTVGAAAVDCQGHVAAATSTGGVSRKQPGRIGDSAIVGAGTYADDRCGAASATGDGEAIIVAGLTRRAVALLGEGLHPSRAARHVLLDLPRSPSGAGLILVDCFGRIGSCHNTPSMTTAHRGGR